VSADPGKEMNFDARPGRGTAVLKIGVAGGGRRRKGHPDSFIGLYTRGGGRKKTIKRDWVTSWKTSYLPKKKIGRHQYSRKG